MPNRVTHFEIQADDVERAITFYSAVFGWEFPKWMDGYWGIMTAPKESTEKGINGGLLKRPCPAPAQEQAAKSEMGEPRPEGRGTNAFVCTVQVDDFDDIAAKIETAGGKVAMAKFKIMDMAWQGYFLDTEGNTFGVHQTISKSVV